ncbi:MAG: cell envelope protein [Arthrobacter sp.]|nr:cell envelope protein [Arthrobacter sp.]
MAEEPVTAAEARAIAKEAYVYGFPMVDNYRILYAYFVNRGSPEFKAPWNQLVNTPRVYTPEDKAIQTPNSDTPYSFIGLDLRAEPMVLTVPPIDEERYFSIQLIDLYTFNFGYIGSRSTGNDGGSFLVAGPSWRGETPEGITKVFHSETELVLAGYRTQLFNPGDLDNVKQIQSGYKAQPLSAFLGQPPAPPAPPVDFPKPLTPEEEKTSLEMFNLQNFLLQFCPTHPTEVELKARFAKIGVVPGQIIEFDKLDPGIRMALEQGIEDAWKDFAELKKRIDAGELTSGQMFGTREFLQNNYLYRMAAALLGIYGNSKAEAVYPIYSADAGGQPLDGASRYALRFAPGGLPPVNAFWSLTMYELPESLLVANPLDRYLINSPMLPQLEKDPDGGLTLVIQSDSPGTDKEANWLPAPKGPFMMAMRLYWPKDEALTGQWTAPPLQQTQ